MEGQRLWDNGPYFAQSEHFKLGTDSVLLGDFVNIGGRVRGIDLGCGSGILPLLLLWRSDRLHMTGLEIDPAAADMARENMAENGLSGRCEIVTGDIKDCRLLFASGESQTRRISPRAAAGYRRTAERLRQGASCCAALRISAARRRICAARAVCSASCTAPSASPTSCAHCAAQALSRSAFAPCPTAPKRSPRSSLSRRGGAEPPGSG